MKRRLLPFLLAGALTAAFAAPVSAQSDAICFNVGRGGAAALVSLVNANISGVGVNVCDVDVLNNSLNNLLRNADVHVLENILNNSPILSGNDIDVTIADNNTDIIISVLSGPNIGDNLTITGVF